MYFVIYNKIYLLSNDYSIVKMKFVERHSTIIEVFWGQRRRKAPSGNHCHRRPQLLSSVFSLSYFRLNSFPGDGRARASTSCLPFPLFLCSRISPKVRTPNNLMNLILA